MNSKEVAENSNSRAIVPYSSGKTEDKTNETLAFLQQFTQFLVSESLREGQQPMHWPYETYVLRAALRACTSYGDRLKKPKKEHVQMVTHSGGGMSDSIERILGEPSYGVQWQLERDEIPFGLRAISFSFMPFQTWNSKPQASPQFPVLR